LGLSERYLRNVAIPGFGEQGQTRLASSRVLVAGLGGLGSPAALYLAAAGVGTLGLLDSDVVEESNLQRQLLHATRDIGRPKIESAAESIGALNPNVRVELIRERISAENARDLIQGYDAVVEASDNFPTKFIVNDACVKLRKPFATAGILCLSGQAQFVAPGQTACLRCAVPEPPQPPGGVPGVLGAAPGVMGSLEAMEVIRWLAGLWKPQRDGAALLHCLDGDSMRLKTLRVLPRRGCACGAWSKLDG
jgi:adenylyltransferase/sulfurtransferase